MLGMIMTGGFWRNTEDEILKAAVMKYRTNQWSRIASLLPRKSAKECKTRWFGWLDPRIKEASRDEEWSREEDEILLLTVNAERAQWRHFAEMELGRTTAQLVERCLLYDDAEMKEEGDDAADDPRKLNPGEIDPNPKTMPARSNPNDTDEDELKMLKEMRARILNVLEQRENRKLLRRQIEKARRLAALRRLRKMRAARITVFQKNRRRKHGVNYNTEIPFEKRPAKKT